MKEAFKKIKEQIERFIPMTFGSLILFCFVIYLLIVVGKTVISNYKDNQEIAAEQSKLVAERQRLKEMQYEINYFQTNSFKEKEARAKLGYKAPGESVLALPIDTDEEKSADSALADAKVKTPNYRLWWQYFFGNRD